MKKPNDVMITGRKGSIFTPGKKAKALFLFEGAFIGVFVCWLVYNSWHFFPVGAAAAAFIYFLKIKESEDEAKRKYLIQFAEYVRALHSSMRSGYSLENAAVNAAESMKELYGENTVIYSEIRRISQGLKVSRTPEEMFAEMGVRSRLEDVVLFADLISICKRSGGDMGKLLSDTGRILDEKAETEKQIQESIAGKRMELKIMSLMPALIVIYVRLCFPGFKEVLYGTFAGVALMSVCLAVYAAAYIWGRKMVKIEV